VFPACSASDARHALDAVRARLDGALTVAGLPRYTASFGVVDAAEHESLAALLARADAALFEAKRLGRDRVVVHDAHGAVVEAPAAGGAADEGAAGGDAGAGAAALPPPGDVAAQVHRHLR
jgi:hypothetical protein